MEQLKVRRGRVKGALTRIYNYAQRIPESATAMDIDRKRQKVEEIWSEYHNIDSEIINELTDPNAVVSEEDLIEFEDNYYRTMQLLDFKAVDLLRQETNNQSMQPAFNLTGPNTTINEIRTESQLPKIQIKPFSGDLTEWDTFRDLYESTVHGNQNLSPCQKFYYLKSFLIHEPANLLTHISVTDTNYLEAWEKLNKRYDKKGHIASALIKKFINLSHSSQSSYTSLRKLVDSVDEIIRGLRALGQNAETRDIWLIHLLLIKLDSETQNAWAKITTENQFPTFAEFLVFLEKRCDILANQYSAERCRKSPATNVIKCSTNSSNFKSFHTTTTTTTNTSSCIKCNSAHELYQCAQFTHMSPQLRRTFVQSNSLCFNCLRAGHRSTSCRSLNSCKQCHRRHHSLIHTTPTLVRTNVSNLSTPTSSTASTRVRIPQSTNSTIGNPVDTSTPIQSNHSVIDTSHVLVNAHSAHATHVTEYRTYLPTAVVNTKDNFGTTHSIRILLDTGSQCSFISEACARRLSLSRSHANIPVSGLSSTGAGTTKGSVTLTLQSRLSNKSLTLTAFIMSKLTSLLPNFTGIHTHWTSSHNLIKLADPEYDQPGPIDVIIGAEKAFLILENQIIKGPPGAPSAILTMFGWVIAGETLTQAMSSDNCSQISCFHNTLDNDFDLKRFWELEEVTSHSQLSEEEQRAEQHFKSTHSRVNGGKYVVELPFKDGTWKFDNSLSAAISRQKAMERKFTQNSTLKEKYSDFMAEYLALGHMSSIPLSEISTRDCYYLPHHAVFKEDSSTTKLRVVFDGSSKCSNELSLNETLCIGAPIQRDLIGVCIRFRRHKYCFSADIQQMFRQIWIAEKHRDFQRIVWRDDATKPLVHYRLNTVTYGTSAAPFLSVRTLNQLAEDNATTYPEVAEMILKDFYVDDILSGADTAEGLADIKHKLDKVLSSAGFNLRKWSSNCLQFLMSIPENQREISPLKLQDSSSIKLLGMCWCPTDDTFSYKIILPVPSRYTKRSMLSEAARVFDPLGFLAPSVVLIKLLFQELWCRKLDWDESLPDDLATHWNVLRAEISHFEQLHITRRICFSTDFELHGFCDASEKAYAAVIYCRSRDESQQIRTTLVFAKTKAAPLKQISLPRLELCGAVLLSRLFNQIFLSFQMKQISFFAWTDSQLVLQWLSSPPRRWSTFIANRTSEILSTAPRNHWSHVKSAYNPADCASRGLLPSDLVKSKLWWEGPSWLSQQQSDWPTESTDTIIDTKLLEERKAALNVLSHHVTVTDNDSIIRLVEKTSSWSRLYRIVAFCLRFMYNIKKENKQRRQLLSLRTSEINKAKTFLLQFAQRSTFLREYTLISQRQQLQSNNKIIQLTPFIDSDQLLRVGGRINRSALSYNTKHPIILPKDHAITKLIIKYTHEKHLHVGVSNLFNILRQQYWIIGCRNLIRKVIHDCVICFKQRKATITQLMGELPAVRLQYSRPFRRVGVDYAGPLTIRSFRGRNPKFFKGYICLFVCFTTKAIHLELAGDLTTETFLAALDRFCARRGKPTELFSDNGTNFQGANRKLNEMDQLFASNLHNNIVIDHMSPDNITWHFIPPSSPHFGGLWEAGVKSVKTHLKRVIGDHILTFEEMYTLLTRIECILNSRPLVAISDSDIDALTPAHFLIGEPYTAIPEPDVHTQQISLHKNWTLLRNLSQGFWKRWHREYITSLQQRPKWNKIKRDISINDVVLLHESNLPASKWILGRIVKVIHGSDGHVRIAHVKTTKGVYERPITKLAVLPVAESDLSGSAGMFRND